MSELERREHTDLVELVTPTFFFVDGQDGRHDFVLKKEPKERRLTQID